MKDFDWTSFTRRVYIKSSLATMYNAWTSSTEIEKWFLRKAVYKNADDSVNDRNKNVVKGLNYEWNWFTYVPTEYGKILEANGKDFFSFSFAGNCIVEIKLAEMADHIMVELTQSNIPTDDESKRDIRLGCDSGWSFYLVNLKSVYEGGLDLRNKNSDFKSVTNS